MTDQLAGSEDAAAASASAPGLASSDIERIKAELSAEFEKRAQGFQRLVSQRDERLEALTSELEEFKTASLPEEEREQLSRSKKDKMIAELQAQLELRDLAGEYGTEMPYFQRLLGAESAKDQLEIIRDFAKTLKPVETPPAAGGEMEIPDVDMNRPMRASTTGGTQLPDGTYMTDALADQILGSFNRQADATQRNLR